MTQLACWVGRDRAVVGIDTRMTVRAEPDPASALGQQLTRERAAIGNRPVEGSKLLSLPHARLVLAHMGSGAFLGVAFLACQAQLGADDFDALDAKMPGLLAGAFGSLLGQHRAHYAEVPVEAVRGQLVLLVGWSARRGRVCAAIFQQRPEAEGFQRTPLAGFTDDEDPRGRRFAAPWNMQKRGPLPYATTPEAMEQIARAQMDDFGGVAAGRGGRLLVAELTRDAVSVRSQCDLEDEPATKLKVEPRAEPGPPAVSKGRISNVTPPTVAAPRQTGAGHAVVFGRW